MLNMFSGPTLSGGGGKGGGGGGGGGGVVEFLEAMMQIGYFGGIGDS